MFILSSGVIKIIVTKYLYIVLIIILLGIVILMVNNIWQLNWV